jgi:hypothetical protein
VFKLLTIGCLQRQPPQLPDANFGHIATEGEKAATPTITMTEDIFHLQNKNRAPPQIEIPEA